MKLLTRDSRYSVRALTAMARHEARQPGARYKVDVLAGEEGIPRDYLRALLQVLARAGLLVSHKGKHGGFSFKKPPQKMTMGDIIKVFQGELDEIDCAQNGQGCTQRGQCTLRQRMAAIHGVVECQFGKVTINSLVHGKERKQP
jgi:Rrf2 family protein